jgi:hypothetical protein
MLLRQGLGVNLAYEQNWPYLTYRSNIEDALMLLAPAARV